MAKFLDLSGLEFFWSKVKGFLDAKVDAVDGKGLSTNDYTTVEKNKLAGIAAGANNYSLPTASSTTLGGVKTTSTVTSNTGYTACPIIGGIPYYKASDGATYSAITNEEINNVVV